MNQSVNDEAVYRTAPATPGLLKTCMGDKTHKMQLINIQEGKLCINGVKKIIYTNRY